MWSRALRSSIPSLVALALAAATTTPAAAQDARALPAGERLRIHTGEEQATYRLVGTEADTLVVLRSGRTTPERIGMTSIARLERSTGRRSAMSGFGRGAAIGGLSGLVIGGGIGLAASGGDDADSFIISDGEATALLAAVGLAGGSLLGGLIGSSVRRERWESVPLVQRVSVAPMRGGLGVRVAF